MKCEREMFKCNPAMILLTAENQEDVWRIDKLWDAFPEGKRQLKTLKPRKV